MTLASVSSHVRWQTSILQTLLSVTFLSLQGHQLPNNRHQSVQHVLSFTNRPYIHRIPALNPLTTFNNSRPVRDNTIDCPLKNQLPVYKSYTLANCKVSLFFDPFYFVLYFSSAIKLQCGFLIYRCLTFATSYAHNSI